MVIIIAHFYAKPERRDELEGILNEWPGLARREPAGSTTAFIAAMRTRTCPWRAGESAGFPWSGERNGQAFA